MHASWTVFIFPLFSQSCIARTPQTACRVTIQLLPHPPTPHGTWGTHMKYVPPLTPLPHPYPNAGAEFPPPSDPQWLERLSSHSTEFFIPGPDLTNGPKIRTREPWGRGGRKVIQRGRRGGKKSSTLEVASHGWLMERLLRVPDWWIGAVISLYNRR